MTNSHILEQKVMIIIRGYPAVGKTTVGRALRDRFGNAVCISVDSVIEMLGPFDVSANKRLGHMASRWLAMFFIEKGMNIILEELFVDKVSVDNAILLAEQAGYEWFIFELDARPQDIRARDDSPDRLHTQNLERLLRNLEGRYYHEPRAIHIGTSDLNPEKTVNAILAVLADHRPT